LAAKSVFEMTCFASGRVRCKALTQSISFVVSMWEDPKKLETGEIFENVL